MTIKCTCRNSKIVDLPFNTLECNLGIPFECSIGASYPSLLGHVQSHPCIVYSPFGKPTSSPSLGSTCPKQDGTKNIPMSGTTPFHHMWLTSRTQSTHLCKLTSENPALDVAVLTH